MIERRIQKVVFYYLKVENPTFYSEDIEEQTLELGYKYEAKVAPIKFDFTASPIPDGCSLDCHFSYSAVLPCARCLEDVEVNGETFFMVELKPKALQPEQKKCEEIDEEEEIEEKFLEEEFFETKELVLEQLYLLLPTKVLCKEDCKGLCPICGENKNLVQCSCIEIDPRWEPLKNLFKKE